MTIKHTAEMELSESMPVSLFVEFISRIPEDATIITTVNITPKDRPWESEVRKVTLRAEWGV
jgi:hypothetical protein